MPKVFDMLVPLLGVLLSLVLFLTSRRGRLLLKAFLKVVATKTAKLWRLLAVGAYRFVVILLFALSASLVINCYHAARVRQLNMRLMLSQDNADRLTLRLEALESQLNAQNTLATLGPNTQRMRLRDTTNIDHKEPVSLGSQAGPESKADAMDNSSVPED